MTNSTKSYDIEYFPEQAYGAITWHRYMSSKEFRASVQEFLTHIGGRPLRKVLQDARKLDIISTGDQN
jgi:hypothetical protein